MEQLRAIFPDTDADVCEAVLTANDGNVEAAINALLEISNPSSAPESNIGAAQADTSTTNDEALARALAQQEEDEELARRLEEEERQGEAAQRHRQLDEDPSRPRSPSPFRETKEKVIAGASAIGESAKKKFKELYDKAFTTKESGSSARQQYNNLPEDDFDALLVDSEDTPLERKKEDHHEDTRYSGNNRRESNAPLYPNTQ
ncbi:hypothetical protein SpCBS45565_g03143 [Spizellomyces sp. 'palustris']|nr:hypothetical protein SpCBS45565_g03143 [Spizellomyces sp. 'palustris']